MSLMYLSSLNFGKNKLALAAIVLLVAQVASCAAFGTSALGVAFGDSVLLAVSLMTAVTCFIASRRSRHFIRSFWFVVGAAFTLWSAGQSLDVYQDLTVRSWPIVQTLLYFISITMIFMVVFATSGDTDEGGVHWPWVLDTVQILVLILAGYLFFVYVPTLIHGPESIHPLRLRLLHWRNIALFAGLTIRAVGERDRVYRRLFGFLAFAIAIYTAASFFANRADLLYGEAASPWYNLAWCVPFTLITIQAATWKFSENVAPSHLGTGKVSSLIAIPLVYLPSLAIPIVLLLFYVEVVKEQVVIGMSALMLSIICFSLRLVLLHRQQQKTLNALRSSEERYRSLFDSNVAGVFRSTIDGRMLECNLRFCEMFGYTRAELLARPSWDLYPGGKPERDQVIAERSLMGLPGLFEQKLLRKDGSQICVLTSATAGKCADGSTFIEGTMLDVTERRRLEEQLFQAQRMEAVGRLAGGIAHDFNNVLTVITGYSAMLIARSDPSDPIFEEAQEIRSASERAASLTRQLLAFSRQQVLQPQVVSLNSILEGIVKMIGRLIGEDIDMSLRCASNLGAVKADPGQIEQILLNLVVNSRDAMPSGGMLTLETANVDLDAAYALAHPYMTAGPHVMLAVSDSGVGMDAATRSRIFEPFFTTKEHGKGTGLGLSTVYGIVKQSGGHIEVYSEPDKGSTFKIYFPRIVDATVPATFQAREATVPSNKGRETILLVEDDDALRKLAQRALVDHGYHVIAIAKPEDAEAICQKNATIDLLLTDVVMPGMSGREVALRATEARPGIRVLYMSGYTTNAIVDHGVLDEGLAFLPKPFTPASLTNKVREILDWEVGRDPAA